MPVIIKSPIDVVVKLTNGNKTTPANEKTKAKKTTGKGKAKSTNGPTFFTDEDLIHKAKSDKITIPPEILFNFIDALDAYEVEKGLEEILVVDITEITNDGLVVIHIEPKKMIQYSEIYEHIDIMLQDAFRIAKMEDYQYEIKKILFRIYKPGTPSSVVDDLSELKDKVDELWEAEFGDEMKSYV